MLHASNLPDLAHGHITVEHVPSSACLLTPEDRDVVNAARQIMTRRCVENFLAPRIVEVSGQCSPDDGASTSYLPHYSTLVPEEALDYWDRVAAEYDGWDELAAA